MAAVRHHRLRRRPIRLFDEAPQRRWAGSAGRDFEVSIRGFSPIRADAEGDDTARLRRCHPGLHSGAKGMCVRHMMIGRSGKDQRLRVVLRQPQRCGQKRRGRVAGRWLQQDGAGVDPDFGQLLRDDETERLIGHGHGRGEARPRETQRGLLKQAGVADQSRELLGITLAGQGPKPRARSAAQDDGRYGRRHRRFPRINAARAYPTRFLLPPRAGSPVIPLLGRRIVSPCRPEPVPARSASAPTAACRWR